MEFKEIKRQPEFVLNLSLEEAIALWRIVNQSHNKGNNSAKLFVEALHELADRSNSYEEYLNN